TITADGIEELIISGGNIEKYNITNTTKLTIAGIEVSGLITTTVKELYLTNTKISDSEITNAEYIETTGNIENVTFTNNGKIISKNNNITKTVFDNAPIEIYNTKLFNNTIKNAEIGITIKEAEDEDSVYIMKNTFKGNTTDIKSEVTREINAQYNYFAEGEAKTEGTIDTTNSLAE
ncbi:hypothetical protein XO12_11020, partial [Marinitoga sp. 1154]